MFRRAIKDDREQLLADRKAARERLAARFEVEDDVFGHAILTEDWVRAARAVRKATIREAT